MRLRAWLICHTFSSSYSSKASSNWAGVKPRETQRCSASAIRTTPPAPVRPATPSVASSRTREKITSDGLWVLNRKSSLNYTLRRKNKLDCAHLTCLCLVLLNQGDLNASSSAIEELICYSNISWQLTVARPKSTSTPFLFKLSAVWRQLHKHLRTFTASSGIYSFSYRRRSLIKRRLWIGWNSADPRIRVGAHQKPIVKSETLTWWYWTCQLGGNPWTSPLAAWPHWHLPSQQPPTCADEPEKKKEATTTEGKHLRPRVEWNRSLTLIVVLSKLSCAGTVRPRQVQCPLWWPAIAQVSASQHQPISLKDNVRYFGDCGFELDEGSGRGQLCMGLHSCSLQTQADCPPCKASQDQMFPGA